MWAEIVEAEPPVGAPRARRDIEGIVDADCGVDERSESRGA
jgi:hypothetical protein